MFRTSLLAVAVFFTACGVDADLPRRGDESAPLTHEEPVQAQPANEPLKLYQLPQAQQLKPSYLTAAVPVLDTVQVHSLNVPDGTQVRFVLGMMGCGISVVSQGAAAVHGGAFEIPYDAELSELGQVSLFFQIGAGVCDPETTQVYEVPAQLPGSVDLSVLPAESFVGCWLFEQ